MELLTLRSLGSLRFKFGQWLFAFSEPIRLSLRAMTHQSAMSLGRG